MELPTLVYSKTIPNHCFVALAESRVIKSIDERKLLRYASWVSSNAHAEVMREAKAGMMEYQLEARFLRNPRRRVCPRESRRTPRAGSKEPADHVRVTRHHLCLRPEI